MKNNCIQVAKKVKSKGINIKTAGIKLYNRFASLDEEDCVAEESCLVEEDPNSFVKLFSIGKRNLFHLRKNRRSFGEMRQKKEESKSGQTKKIKSKEICLMKFATANNQEEDIWKILARNEILKTSKQALK